MENWYIELLFWKLCGCISGACIYVCVHLQCLYISGECFQHPFVVCSLFLLARSCIVIVGIQIVSTLPHMCTKGMASRLCIWDSQQHHAVTLDDEPISIYPCIYLKMNNTVVFMCKSLNIDDFCSGS